MLRRIDLVAVAVCAWSCSHGAPVATPLQNHADDDAPAAFSVRVAEPSSFARHRRYACNTAGVPLATGADDVFRALRAARAIGADAHLVRFVPTSATDELRALSVAPPGRVGETVEIDMRRSTGLAVVRSRDSIELYCLLRDDGARTITVDLIDRAGG
nr:hypothetical protein [Kofleriaceae bacterium]